jgi:hypothetical protein
MYWFYIFQFFWITLFCLLKNFDALKYLNDNHQKHVKEGKIRNLRYGGWAVYKNMREEKRKGLKEQRKYVKDFNAGPTDVELNG